MNIALIILGWLLFNTWITLVVLTKQREPIYNFKDLGQVALCSIFTLPLVSLAYVLYIKLRKEKHGVEQAKIVDGFAICPRCGQKAQFDINSKAEYHTCKSCGLFYSHKKECETNAK